MNESQLLQNLLDETVELRETVYCLGLYCVALLAALFGGRR